jgi:hypothetical protein
MAIQMVDYFLRISLLIIMLCDTKCQLFYIFILLRNVYNIIIHYIYIYVTKYYIYIIFCYIYYITCYNFTTLFFKLIFFFFFFFKFLYLSVFFFFFNNYSRVDCTMHFVQISNAMQLIKPGNIQQYIT